jgi:hypothetical protein
MPWDAGHNVSLQPFSGSGISGYGTSFTVKDAYDVEVALTDSRFEVDLTLQPVRGKPEGATEPRIALLAPDGQDLFDTEGGAGACKAEAGRRYRCLIADMSPPFNRLRSSGELTLRVKHRGVEQVYRLRINEDASHLPGAGPNTSSGRATAPHSLPALQSLSVGDVPIYGQGEPILLPLAPR